MPNSGGQVVTPITPPVPPVPPGPIVLTPYPQQVVKSATALIDECSTVKLARYAQIIEYDERAFFGIYFEGIPDFKCRNIWTLSQRKMIAKYLCEAQIEIEQETGYPIGVRWITEDERPYNRNGLMSAKYTHVVQGGIRAVETLAANEAIDHANDPAVIGPIALVQLYSSDEIRVFYPGTEIEIPPSEINIDSTLLTVTIKIPRARLVAPAFIDNPETGLSYTDVGMSGPYLQEVDVARVYNDTSQQAVLHKPSTCSTLCSITDHAGCIQVLNHNLGSLRIIRTAAQVACGCGSFSNIHLYYQAGIAMTSQAEDAIIRLAHSKMPTEPCGCDIVQRLWERDRKVPDAMSAERAANPFGLSDGAWVAWKFANAMKIVKGSVL